MAADSDACVPQALTDFVFDLFDSVTLSQITEEQSNLYNNVFRDLSGKYFSNSPWPSPQSIASECNGDPLFLAFYRELTHRHWHAVSRPTLRDRMEGWDVYRDLFDELLETAEGGAPRSNPPNLFILPEWAFDILHEFVYQFQGFCQFRTALYANAEKYNLLGEGQPLPNAPHHVVENVAILSESYSNIWNVDTVLSYLHRLVAIGTAKTTTVPAYQYFGIFASVALSRLECLLADYSGCLQAMAPILESADLQVIKHDQEPQSFTEVVHSVFPARLSLTYHAGISFLMMRRYKDAIDMVGEMCSYMQRGFKTGLLRKLPNSDQYYKNYDRMLALLAICTHLCPQSSLEESLVRSMREKHGGQLAKEAYVELFQFCAPKFVSPVIPDFTKPGVPIESAQKHQIKMLENELKPQPTFKELRGFLKLYTSMEVSKLVNFGNDEVSLMALKLNSRQLESDSVPSLKAASVKSALDIHYYLDNDKMVHIDAAEKQRRFENYFLGQTVQSYDIRKDANAINTDV
eukprot:Nitzschia sp. Nitz4//scaffold55_size114948//20290//22050//NITZ4_003886-RA/size114948-snap-gene-0.167-mRNA-1//1//CDS//3329554485//9459//frame0